MVNETLVCVAIVFLTLYLLWLSGRLDKLEERNHP